MSVVAIRGTRFNKKTDIVQDIDLYIEVGLLQVIFPAIFKL